MINRMKNSGGFEAVNLANGVEILKAMSSDGNCVKFLSFVGAIISTGTRGIIRELVKEHADCIVTTCVLDHDITNSANYYDFRLKTLLLKVGIHRLAMCNFLQIRQLTEKKVRVCLDELYFDHIKNYCTIRNPKFHR
jgi:deoxyhypusine synthase